MDSLLQSIGDWIKQGLIDAIMGSFTGMYDALNNQVGAVASQVGQTPEAMSPGVFSMIRTLSETVILPIAGMVLTFVLCYELIQMIIDRNNLHDFETWMDIQNLLRHLHPDEYLRYRHERFRAGAERGKPKRGAPVRQLGGRERRRAGRPSRAA